MDPRQSSQFASSMDDQTEIPTGCPDLFLTDFVNIDAPGCKKCDCKQHKCTKRQCQCVAAGIYCSDDCACRVCYNRPATSESHSSLAAGSSEADSWKWCTCKKNKCLKRSCSCFGAGTYCTEGCVCQGCFNRPEYEDAVLTAREAIEFFNPFAFAPKPEYIVTPPARSCEEDETHFTPSAEWYSCKCKKTMCLKKHCECYRAKVACSVACQCKECKNSYGRRECN